MGIDIIDRIEKEEFRDITYKEIILCYDEETDSEFYRVEWVDEIQDGCGWENEAEFDTLDEAYDFYNKINEPKEYVSRFNSNGFSWRRI